MAITVDYSTQPYTIEFKQADLTLVSGTRYQITVNYMWQLLREYSDGSEGAAYPITYRRIPATASTPAITEINDPVYQAQFEDGAYSVDIINGNTNFRDVEVKNQVSVGTNNTTGFIDPTFLESGLFNDVVAVDVLTGVAGTDKTTSGGIIGTLQTPSNNMADALIIAQNRGLGVFLILSSMTLTSSDFSSGYIFKGSNANAVVLTIDDAANVTNCEFRNLTVQGTIDNNNTLRECSILNVTHINGFMFECAIVGTITLGGGSQATILSCYSGVAGGGPGQTPVIDMGGSGQTLALRDYSGGLELQNGTGANNHSLDFSSGRLVIDSTVTNGNYTVRGIADVTDNSTGSAVIADQTLSVKLDSLHKLQGLDPNNPMTVTPTSRTAGDIEQVITGDGLTTSTVTRQ